MFPQNLSTKYSQYCTDVRILSTDIDRERNLSEIVVPPRNCKHFMNSVIVTNEVGLRLRSNFGREILQAFVNKF